MRDLPNDFEIHERMLSNDQDVVKLPSNVALSRGPERVGCGSGLCRTL